MADNVTLETPVNPGAVCSTDDCGANGQVQRIKLAVAADGSATHIPADSKGLQVQQPTAADFNATVVGSVTANAGANLNTSALATEVTLGTIHGHVDSIDGKITACNTGAVTVSASALPSGASTSALQGAGLPAALGAGGGLKVDGSGTALPISGSVTANAGTNLNTSALAVETGGNLAAAATSLAIIDDWDSAASDACSVAGDVAHDTADAGEPVKMGAKATASLSALTLVADNDRTNLFSGLDGAQIVRPHCNLEDIVTGNANNTDGASTQCIAAQAAGIKTYLTSIILTNTSSSNIYVEIKDDATVKVTIPLPANSGAIFNPPVPIPGTAAKAWSFDPSAAATTVYCSMIGFKSKL